MKPFSSALIFFFSLISFSSSTFAGDVCDTSCDLTITFPDGGTLTATEALTFTFGNGGVISLGETGTINTAVQPSFLEYTEGGSLALGAGESITFDVGGFVKTAPIGNLNYTNIEIVTNVDFDVVLDDGSTTVVLSSITAGTLSITANGSIEMSGNSTLNVDTLIITTTGDIIVNGDIGGGTTVDGCTAADGSLIINSGGIGTVDNGCTGTIEIGGGTGTGVVIIGGGTGGGIIGGGTIILDPPVLVITDITPPVTTLNGAQGDVIDLLEGDTYIEDGASCIDVLPEEGTGLISVGELVVTIGGDVIPDPVTITDQSYVVTYDCVDLAGNEAEQLSRTINVIFSAEYNISLINDAANFAVDELNAANLKGRKGLINKLVGSSGVVAQVEAAVSAFYGDEINLDDYFSALDEALEKLGDFDNQLAAKIRNGQLGDPAASEVLGASAEINGLINKLIDNAE